MKKQGFRKDYRKGLAFLLTLAMAVTTLFGGFSFVGIKGAVQEVYAGSITPRTTTLDLTGLDTTTNTNEGWDWNKETGVVTLSGINLSTTSAQALIVPTNAAIVLVGDNRIESTQAPGGESFGIYGVNGLTIGGTGTLTVTGGTTTDAFPAPNRSFGIYTAAGDITINEGTIIATGGMSVQRSYGIAPYSGTVFIKGGTVRAIGGNSQASYGLAGSSFNNGGNIEITGGTVITDTGTTDIDRESTGMIAERTTISGINTRVESKGENCGICMTKLVINDGAHVTATGKNTAKSRSYGIFADELTLNGSSTVVNATGGNVTYGSGDGESYGMYGVLTMNGGTLNATGGNSVGAGGHSYGLNSYTLAFNGGTTNAVSGTATTRAAIIATGGSNAITFGTGPATMVTTPAGAGLSSDGTFIATESGGTIAATSVVIGAYIPAPTYTMTASPLSAFASQTVGYTTAPAVQTVTITNTGNQSITLTQPTSIHYNVTSLSAITVTTGATVTFTIQPKTGLAVGAYPETISIVGSNGSSTSVSAQFIVTTAANNGSNGGGGSSTTTINTTIAITTNITVNGQPQNAGTVSTSKDGDRTVTTVTIDDTKIQEKINAEGNKSTVSIPISGNTNISQGVLNGQTIKDMEKKESVLEIRTNSTTYTLPASGINIDNVSSIFGKAVELKDIKISIKIAEPSADTAKIVKDTASKNNYQVAVQPVEFEITCSNGNKTVSISKFNGYVQRMVAIPEGIDPKKVTTGIVLNSDGTFSHVPTTVVKVDGKYYAKISSLTNSTYSVIYNPIEFADVAKHEAKDVINNMGSRLVISGIGNGNYGPDNNITRAEFAAIIVRALGLTEDSGESSFADVKTSSWYSGYVKTAVSYGIITGYSKSTFGPQDKITKEQAMVMMSRAMKLTGLYSALTDAEINNQIKNYIDGSSVSNYAKPGTAVCLKTGVASGKAGGSLAPKEYITRADVAVMVERMLQKSGLI